MKLTAMNLDWVQSSNATSCAPRATVKLVRCEKCGWVKSIMAFEPDPTEEHIFCARCRTQTRHHSIRPQD